MRLIVLMAFSLLSLLTYSQYDPLLYSWGDYNGSYSVSKIEENGDNFRILKIQTISMDMLKKRNGAVFADVFYRKGMK
jgi:hypothetical protein